MIEIKNLTVGFNRPDFFDLFVGKEPLLDNKGHPRAFELTLDEGMQGKKLGEDGNCVLVQFSFYPIPVFVWKKHISDSLHTINFPKYCKAKILDRLISCVGKPYLWGGNSFDSTDEFKNYFNYSGKNIREKRAIHVDGIDCSGLLFFASGYKTPRNTKDLLSFGHPIEKNSRLQSLDLILTPGHVAIVLDDHHIIQSKENRGVYITRIKEELNRLERKKAPILRRYNFN